MKDCSTNNISEGQAIDWRLETGGERQGNGEMGEQRTTECEASAFAKASADKQDFADFTDWELIWNSGNQEKREMDEGGGRAGAEVRGRRSGVEGGNRRPSDLSDPYSPINNQRLTTNNLKKGLPPFFLIASPTFLRSTHRK